MEKRAIALALTCLVVGGALLFSRGGGGNPGSGYNRETRSRAQNAGDNQPEAAQARSPGPSGRESPENAVWAMTDAWRVGDVPRFLECYAESMRARLERAAREMGETAFSNELRESYAELVGLAISGVKHPEDDSALVPLEFVHRGKNEVQSYVLRKMEGEWKIVGTQNAKRIPTIIPYGTPAAPARKQP